MLMGITDVDRQTAAVVVDVGQLASQQFDVHECLVFYVAAHLLAYDDAYRYTVFLNMYEERISRLKEPIWLEPGIIEDVYRSRR